MFTTAGRLRGRGTRTVVMSIVLAIVLAIPVAALANVLVTTVSSDPYTTTTSFHKTEVEPDTFAFGSTIVAAFQVGRFADGGGANIGWATSTNNGATWTNGFLPGLTTVSVPAGPYNRATDASVAYDARHNVWMINSLGLTVSGTNVNGTASVVNRSTDGGLTWGNAVVIGSVTGTQDFDKNWIVCDNTSTSPFYGNCYAEWDDFGHNNRLLMRRSTDGGLTWTASTAPNRSVIGGQPVVLPSGRVVVPIDNGAESAVQSFVSTNGGASYTGPSTIATISSHTTAGNLRSGPLPSAEVDGAGKVYVVWSDCRFRSGCTANDIVMSTSTNGTSWTSVVRIPIDATTSGIDHFLPGLAVDPATSGATAHLGLMYYYYTNTSCTTATCQMNVGFISSSNGGSSWTAPTQLVGPFALNTLPLTSQGYMVGDYSSASFVGGTVRTVFAIGNAVTGKTCTLGDITSCDEPMVSPTSGLSAAAAGTRAASSAGAAAGSAPPAAGTGSRHHSR